MRCGVCRSPLTRCGYRRREYRDLAGRVYKVINWPRYAPCPRLNDPEAHPARAKNRTRPDRLASGAGKTLAVHQADVFAWQPPADVRWTVAYFDVWPNLCTDNLEAMARLGRRYSKRRADVFLCWGRERLRAERRQEQRSGWRW